MGKKSIKNRSLLTVILVLLFFLFVLLTDFIINKYNTLENGPDSFSNSVWRCREVDIQIIMDKNLECYGIAGTEILKVNFSYNRGHGVKRDFEIYSLQINSLAEVTSMKNVKTERLFQGKLKGCDETGFTCRLGRRKLPLWGFTDPTILHFIREDLSYEADFSVPNNPVFQEFAGE